MIDKIKNLGNWPFIIILAVVVIIAILLSIFKTPKSEETNANTKLNDTTKVEQAEEVEEAENNEEQPLEEVIIDEEIVEETEAEENSDVKYFIRVNYGQNVVTIYTKDSKGEYTVPYKAMLCSTGTATPKSGTYTMPSGTYSRGTWGLMKGNVWAQYFTRIKGSILFHSVPYTEKNKWSLEYWEYDKLGTAASLGCIRLTVENAKWIYNNCPAGTQVEFYTSSNPGPLGKPTEQKISDDESVRGWDPTDPDSANPWKTYKPEKEETKKETTTNTSTTTNKNTSTSTTTKPNKTETSTTITPEEKPKDETPEQNQEEETTTPNEGNQAGENKNPETPPEEDTTNTDDGKIEQSIEENKNPEINTENTPETVAESTDTEDV